MPSNTLHRLLLSLGILLLSASAHAGGSGYYFSSYQISDNHRFEYGKMGSHWGHHLGHMVRTAKAGLWYVDDTGTNVNANPAINYHNFDGSAWTLVKTLNNPNTIQQNTASVAVGDTIYTYGLNINGGYIEEAVFDVVNRVARPYKRLFSTSGGSANYIGAAVSPSGTRVVWWTRVVNNNGPSPWIYRYHDDTGWHGPVQSMVPGNDFSYVFASFASDSELYVAGELPLGIAPNWVFKMGTGKVILGQPLTDFTVMDGNLTAHDIWTNSRDGGVHLFGQSISGQVTYFFKSADGTWPESGTYLPIGAVGRFRIIESAEGKLYLVFSQYGYYMVVMDKARINGRMDFSDLSMIPVNHDQGFTTGGSIWAETRSFQTTPVTSLNFGIHGNDWDYSPLLRHVQVLPNDGSVKLNLCLPNGHETLAGGAPQQLSWYTDAAAGIDSVKIEWSENGGGTWKSVAGSAPNTGRYQWQVPETNSADCLIRVSDIGNPSTSDRSNTPFVIKWVEIIKTPPVAVISSPKNDTTVMVNTSLHAQGRGTDGDGYIVRYQWQSGDGTTASGLSKTLFDHTYTSAGVYYLTLTVKDNEEEWSVPDSVRITVIDPSGVDRSENHTESFQLSAVYPNPFNAGTSIEYFLDRSSPVHVAIYNLKGELVKELANERVQTAGNYRLTWDGRTVTGEPAPTGCYLCCCRTEHDRQIRKMYLVR